MNMGEESLWGLPEIMSCSGQQILATVLEVNQYNRSDSFGVIRHYIDVVVIGCNNQ